MKTYQYQVSIEDGSRFKDMVYFCTNTGECKAEQLPADSKSRFQEWLNQKGEEGWELVQVYFSSEGLVAIWKKELIQ